MTENTSDGYSLFIVQYANFQVFTFLYCSRFREFVFLLRCFQSLHSDFCADTKLMINLFDVHNNFSTSRFIR